MKLHYLMYMVCQLLWHRGAWISKLAAIYTFWVFILGESPTRSFGSDIEPWIAVDLSLSRFELENMFAGRLNLITASLLFLVTLIEELTLSFSYFSPSNTPNYGRWQHFHAPTSFHRRSHENPSMMAIKKIGRTQTIKL